MRIEKKNSNPLEATLSVTIEKKDYQPKFVEELKKYRNKAHIKGFRKGRTPLSTLKRMYGKAVLADVVNEVLQSELNTYLKDEKLNILGNPIPNEDQDPVDFDINEMGDYTFLFDIGIEPEFEVIGTGEEDEYMNYEVYIPEALLKEELNLRRKQYGDPKEEENDVQAGDILTVKATELIDDQPKINGWETDFKIGLNEVTDENLKNDLLKKKKGDLFDFDIYTILKDKSEEFVRKYLLHLDEDEQKEIGNLFRGTIDKVTRMEPAEMDENFFEKAFGKDRVSSEEEALEALNEELSSYYKDQIRSYTYREIMDSIMEKNAPDLPEEFIKRWVKTTNKDLNDEQFEKDFDNFKQELTWTLIKSKLARKYKISVEPEEIKERAKSKILDYLGQYPVESAELEKMAQRYLKDREQISKEYAEIETGKIFEEICKHTKLKVKKLDIEDFREKVKALNERLDK